MNIPDRCRRIDYTHRLAAEEHRLNHVTADMIRAKGKKPQDLQWICCMGFNVTGIVTNIATIEERLTILATHKESDNE